MYNAIKLPQQKQEISIINKLIFMEIKNTEQELILINILSLAIIVRN
jgi:hypothetical protein